MADPPADDPTTDPPYQSLYRRFRPQRFGDVLGQEHVTRALRNSVREGRIAHAYLFSGPRGTGKTSTARILAMALNCEHPADGEPDGTCPSCVDVRRGSSMDVQELDAASNRRIDEMRDLLSRVALGTRGRWKVYIIDEVHQLTGDAASALLKTLEEPPAHVVFVLATTDPQKVLPTIRSRTISFDFHLLSSQVLGHLLHDVNERAHLGVPPEAIDLVVRRGHGSARDALTVLDQVAAGGLGEDPAHVVSQIVDALAERDVGLVLTAVAEGMAAGRDARRLAADLLDHLRNGFLAIMSRGLVMLPDDVVSELGEQARRLGPAALVRAMEVIGQALADMRDSVDPRVTLEVALVRLSRPDADTSPAALLERIERLERQERGARVADLPPVSRSAGAGSGAGAGTASGSGSGAGSAAGPGTASGSGAGAGSAAGPGLARSSLPPPPPVPSLHASPIAPVAPLVPEVPPSPSASEGVPRAGSPASRGSPAGPSPAPGSLPAHAPAVPSSAAPGPLPSAAPLLPPAAPRSATLGPPPPVAPGSPPAVAPGSPPPGPGSAAGPSPPAPAPPNLPSRDALTKAWGDGVLGGLSARAKGYLGSGRFVRVDPDGAVFAVPTKQMLANGRGQLPEAEAALAARFGCRVPLKLVLEADVPPTTAAPTPVPEPEEILDRAGYEALRDADSAVTSPEQRLLDMFPGAEEVST